LKGSWENILALSGDLSLPSTTTLRGLGPGASLTVRRGSSLIMVFAPTMTASEDALAA